MATFDRPRTRNFCKGYLFALDEMHKQFQDTYGHGTVLAKAREEICYFDEETPRGYTPGEMLQTQGSAEAWVDLQSFCMEAQVGWNKKVLDCWLVLRQQVVSAHMMAQP